MIFDETLKNLSHAALVQCLEDIMVRNQFAHLKVRKSHIYQFMEGGRYLHLNVFSQYRNNKGDVAL